MLGAALPWQAWGELGWRGPAFAALLLRRLPALLLLRRPLGLGWADAAYLGWFGAIGVSALLCLTLEAERLGLDPRSSSRPALWPALWPSPPARLFTG